nr:larval cuticle protein [Bombyx mori]
MRVFLAICLSLTVALAAETGKYTPFQYNRVYSTVSPFVYKPGRYVADPGRYDPSRDNSGRYIPDNSGAYNGDRGDRGAAGGFYTGSGTAGGPGGAYVGTKEDLSKYLGDAYKGSSIVPLPVVKPTIPVPVTPTYVASKVVPPSGAGYDYKYGIIRYDNDVAPEATTTCTRPRTRFSLKKPARSRTLAPKTKASRSRDSTNTLAPTVSPTE